MYSITNNSGLSNQERNYRSVVKDVANDFAHNKFHCAYSGKPFTEKMKATVEHIRPHSKGGSIKPENVLPVIQKYNGERSNKPLSEWFKIHPEAIENVKKSIKELMPIKTKRFNGTKWANDVTKTVEREGKIKLGKPGIDFFC